MSALTSALLTFSTSLASQPFGSWWTLADKKPPQRRSPTYVKDTVANILVRLDYGPPEVDPGRRQYLVESLHSEFSVYADNQTWFEVVCAQSAAMAYLSYFGHTKEVQLQAARFTWFMIYFDDFCHKFPESMEHFQRAMLSGTLIKEMPVMGHFRSHLTDMYQLWDSIPANCINASAMEYINGCSLEETPTIQKMELLSTARSWPSYLRTKTGVAAAYAFMIFPRNLHPDISTYIQAIGDISTFIDLTNDVLSFYKETLAGETNNYIHNRAFISGKSVEDTLHDVAQDLLDAHSRITETLECTDALHPWLNFVNGYLAFHVTQSRYRLNDLGF